MSVITMPRLETLREMLAWTNQALKKNESQLRKHRNGTWSNDPHFISLSEKSVEKWTRWRDLLQNLIDEIR